MAMGMNAQKSVEARLKQIREAYANRLNLMQNQPYDNEEQRVEKLTLKFSRMYPGTGLAQFDDTYYWTDDENEDYMLKPTIYFAIEKYTMNAGMYRFYREYLYDPETEEPMFMLLTTQWGEQGKKLEYRFYFDKGKLIKQVPEVIEPAGENELSPEIPVDAKGKADAKHLLSQFEFHRKNLHNNVPTYAW